MDTFPHLSTRMGTFFILVGIGLLIVFVGTGMKDMTHYRFLLGGIASFALGVWLRRRVKKPAEDSGRFRAVRGIHARNKERSAQRSAQRRALRGAPRREQRREQKKQEQQQKE
jgi:hypothetical protein